VARNAWFQRQPKVAASQQWRAREILPCVAAISMALAIASAAGLERPAFARQAPPVVLPEVDGLDLRFTHLAFGADPSHRRVNAFAQDDFGFLWLATDDGLLRWDGYRFRVWRHDPKNSNSPSGTYIGALFKDRSGKLWVATGGKLDVYDPMTETFTPFRIGGKSGEILSARVGEINQDRAGAIWLATDRGLYRVVPETWNTIHYESRLNEPDTLSSDVVRSILETKNGEFWLATMAGLDVLDRQTGKVARRIEFPMEHSVWTKLIEDHAGVVWMSYGRSGYPGLAAVERTTNTLRQYQLIQPGEKVSAGINSMFEDAYGNLWLGGSTTGLFKLDRDRKQIVRYRKKPDTPQSIASDEIMALFADHEGGVWVGTRSDGADRFTGKPLPFQRYALGRDNPNRLEDTIYAVYEDSQGILWVAGVHSLIKADRRSGRFEFYRANNASELGRMADFQVRAIIEDRAGDLWFGTGGGLYRLNRKTGRFQVYRNDSNNPKRLSNNSVNTLLLDHAGTLWAGTDDGLNALDAETGTFRVYAPPVEPTVYRHITEDSHGRLWLSATSGVHRFDPATGKFTVYRHSEAPGSLSGDSTDGICVDGTGRVWVGTGVGLDGLDPSTGMATLYQPAQGAEAIHGILEDAGGNLWLGSQTGLLRFDPNRNTFRRYYASDGLAANERVGVATWKSPRGEMFFGSFSGLTTFFPEQIAEDSYVPPVVLTDIRIRGKPVEIGGASPLKRSISATESLALQYAQNSVEFEFSALSYLDPERSRYRYRLVPLDSEWAEMDSNRRSVTYMSIPSGHYVFRVQGSNGRGVWNENGVRLAISVLPPWWSSWWFRVSLAAAGLLSFWAFHTFRLRQQAYEFNMRLGERIDERTRIARELHDTLLQNFQGALFQFKAAYNQFSRSPEEAKLALGEAIDTAREAITEARDSIQELRATADSQGALEKRLTAAAKEIARAQNTATDSPRFSVVVEGASQPLRIGVQDEVYRIGREVLANAFRHAHATRIEAEVQYDERLLRLRIRDDGVGIDRKVLAQGARDGHWGLPGIRERGKRIGARLEIWSEAGAGTEVELRIPAAVAYAKKQKRRRLGFFRNKSEVSS